jgi:hypothetical protein
VEVEQRVIFKGRPRRRLYEVFHRRILWCAPGLRRPVRAGDVAVTTGDDALGDLPVGLVKIDVEGFEPEVLTGMSRVLVTRQPRIIAECLDPGSLRKVRETASAFGYRHAYHLAREGVVPLEMRPFHPCNYLFTTEPMTATS